MSRSRPVLRHRASRKLLPWYVNGTLPPAERAGVERHVQECVGCRGELASLEELRQRVREAPARPAPAESEAMARGFAEVMARIDAGAAPRSRPSLTVRWVLAGQAAAILILVSLLVWPTAPESPESYRTLSAPHGTAGAGSIRIVFSESATELELRALLRFVEAEIVGGPSSIGAYTLRARQGPLKPGESAELLARLRADPLVRLAEPVAAGVTE